MFNLKEADVDNIFIGDGRRRNRVRPKMDKLKPKDQESLANKKDQHMQDPEDHDEKGNPVERVSKDIGQAKHFFIKCQGPSQFHFLCPLGEGSYSTVYLARDAHQGPDSIPRYAVKVVEKMHVVKNDMVLQTLRELKVMEYLNFERQGHNAIPKLFCTFQDDKFMYSVMNACERGEFGQFFSGGRKMDLEVARFYAAEILDAIDFIHRNGISHRDVKPENIMIKMDGHIVLIDFGSCYVFDPRKHKLNVGVIMHPPRKPRLSDFMDDAPEEMEEKKAEDEEEFYERTRRCTFVGTAQYVSPEMLRGDLVGPACDLWAFACIIYQMLTGVTPFRAANDYQMMKKIRNLEYTFPEGFDPEAKDIVTRLLTNDPDERYTMVDLKAHSFFRGLNWETVGEREPPPAYTYIRVKIDRLNEPAHWADIPTGFNAQIAAKLLNDQIKYSTVMPLDINFDPIQPSSFDFSEDDVEIPEDCIGSTVMQNMIKRTREDRVRKERLGKQADDNKFHQFCQDRLILKMGLLEKKKGMFARTRMFVLTEGPRLFYVKVDNMELKGEIPISPHLNCEVKDFRVFNIHTPRRVYYLFDPESKALDWCKAIMDIKRMYDVKLKEIWADAVVRQVWPAVDMDKKKLRQSEKERLLALRGPTKNPVIKFLRSLKFVAHSTRAFALPSFLFRTRMVFEESTNNSQRPNAIPVNAGSKWAEATSFIRDVKSAYQSDPSPNNYERFLIVLREFKIAHLPLMDCFKIVGGLFKNNPHLIPAFNAFAPPSWRLVYSNGKAYVHHLEEVTEVPDDILETSASMFADMQRELDSSLLARTNHPVANSSISVNGTVTPSISPNANINANDENSA